MSGFDAYGSTEVRIIAALERRIEDLEAQVRNRPGAPVTQASGPLFLPNSATPDVPSGGVKVYAAGGDLRVIDSGGTVKQIPDPGAPVDTPTSYLSNAPASYNQAWAQNLALTADELYLSYVALLGSLRTAGFILT
jgi:hypothetical protein